MQGPVNTPDEAFLALYGMAGSIVEMPPAVKPEDRRDGTYYLDRKVSYNRGVLEVGVRGREISSSAKATGWNMGGMSGLG